MTNKQKLTLLSAVIIVIVLIGGVSLAGIYINRHRSMVLQGQIESEVIKISGKLLGRIDRFYVSEGDNVSVNDTLVFISSLQTDALLQTASAMETVASHQNKKVDKGARKQVIEAAKQAWMSAKAQNELALATLSRIEKLYKDGVVTSQKRDEVAALAASATAAEAATHSQYNMAVEGAQLEDRDASKAMVTAAQGQVKQVEALLKDSKLTAPVHGQISAVYPSVGELVMPGSPIMSITNLDSCYVVINVTEDYLPQFKMGDTFKGNVPAIGEDNVEFRIFYISPLGSFATWRSTKQSGTYDMATFKVKASPIDKKYIEKGLRPGMSVLIEVPRSKRN